MGDAKMGFARGGCRDALSTGLTAGRRSRRLRRARMYEVVCTEGENAQASGVRACGGACRSGMESALYARLR